MSYFFPLGPLQADPEHRGVPECEARRAHALLPVEGGRGGARVGQAEGHDADRPGALQETRAQQNRVRHANDLHP